MKTDAPLVSIIIPCYNYGHLIHETLDSLLAQTYKNWECIIVDDGSTDNTCQVVMKYVDTDMRFKYRHQPNKGLAGARNTGLRLAIGYYIQLLDADDLLPLEKIQKHLSILIEKPEVDLVYGKVYVFDKDLSAIPDAREIVLQSRESGSGKNILTSLLEDNIFLVHCALFKSSLVQDIGFFNEAMTTCEDWNFWFRCALAGKNFLFFDNDKSKVYVRSHGRNMSINRKNMWVGRAYFHQEAARLLGQEYAYKNNDDLQILKNRNDQLLLIVSKRIELTYGNFLKGMIYTVRTIVRYGDFFETTRDSLYWVKERILNRV